MMFGRCEETFAAREQTAPSSTEGEGRTQSPLGRGGPDSQARLAAARSATSLESRSKSRRKPGSRCGCVPLWRSLGTCRHAYASAPKEYWHHATPARNGCSIAASFRRKAANVPTAGPSPTSADRPVALMSCVSDEALPLFRSNSTGTARATEPPGERRRRCAAQDAGPRPESRPGQPAPDIAGSTFTPNVRS